MNTHFHRKQIIILVLAMVLAAASYWIPLPRQTDVQPSPSRLFGSTDQAVPEETVAYAREPATIWRFPVTVHVPQTAVQVAKQSVKEALPVPLLPEKRWIGQQEFISGDQTPVRHLLLAPVKALDQPGR